MKTITIRLNDDTETNALADVLRSLRFVESIDVYDETDELTEDEIRIVEESWAEYKKNPGVAKSWEQVREELQKKYGV